MTRALKLSVLLLMLCTALPVVAAGATGAIRIRCSPDECAALFRGELLGSDKSIVTIPALKPGDHVVTVVRRGKRLKANVTVRAGVMEELYADFEAQTLMVTTGTEMQKRPAAPSQPSIGGGVSPAIVDLVKSSLRSGLELVRIFNSADGGVPTATRSEPIVVAVLRSTSPGLAADYFKALEKFEGQGVVREVRIGGLVNLAEHEYELTLHFYFP